MKAKDSGGGQDFPLIPQGLHLAVCYGVYDLGTHYIERWKKNRHECVILWELPKVRVDVEQEDKTTKNLPRVRSRRFTVTLHKKGDLRPFLISWRGKDFTEEELDGFEMKKLLGAPCQIQIVHNASKKEKGTVYCNVTNIVTAPPGTKLVPENPIAYFSFDDWPGVGLPASTPQWILDIIQGSKEWRGEMAPPNEEVPGELQEDDSYPSQPEEEDPFGGVEPPIQEEIPLKTQPPEEDDIPF